MSNSRSTDRQLQAFKGAFLEFIKDVSLRSDTAFKPTYGPDRLYHFNLNLLASGSLAFEEPNRHGSYSIGNQHDLSLQWEDASLSKAVIEVKRLFPNILDATIRENIRQLMIKVFDDQMVKKEAVSEQEEEKGTQDNSNGEIPSILEVLDITQIDTELTRVTEWLRNLAVLQTVYIPITGVELQSRLTIGDVEFHPNDEDRELYKLIVALEEKGELPDTRETLESAQCFAKVTVIGDGPLARATAVQKIREAIHILNFALSSTFHQPNWAQVQISSIIINKNSPTSDPRDDRLGAHFSYPSNRVFQLTQHEMSNALRPVHRIVMRAEATGTRNWHQEEALREESLNRLLESHQNKSEINTRIQRAVTWYSKAVDADTLEEQFVNLAIALESLLIGDEGKGPYATTGSISQNLGERSAFLLERNFESRHEKQKEVKKLYGIRSAIVHRGESVTPTQLKKMDDLVKEVTLAFLRRNFPSWDDFQMWIARQKFSTKVETTEETISEPSTESTAEQGNE